MQIYPFCPTTASPQIIKCQILQNTHGNRGGGEGEYNGYWYSTNSLTNIIAELTLSTACNSHRGGEALKATSGDTESTKLQLAQLQDILSLP